jgi:hypothetical protein
MSNLQKPQRNNRPKSWESKMFSIEARARVTQWKPVPKSLKNDRG